MKSFIIIAIIAIAGFAGYSAWAPSEPSEEHMELANHVLEELGMDYDGLEITQYAHRGERLVFWAESPDYDVKLVLTESEWNDEAAASLEAKDGVRAYYYGGNWHASAPWIRDVRGVATGPEEDSRFTAYPNDGLLVTGYVKLQ